MYVYKTHEHIDTYCFIGMTRMINCSWKRKIGILRTIRFVHLFPRFSVLFRSSTWSISSSVGGLCGFLAEDYGVFSP